MSTEIKMIVAVSCDAVFCVKHFKSPGRFATGGPEVARCSEQEGILYKLLVRTASFGADFVTFSRIFPEFKILQLLFRRTPDMPFQSFLYKLVVIC